MKEILRALEEWAHDIAPIFESVSPTVWGAATRAERANAIGWGVARGILATVGLIALLVFGTSAVRIGTGLAAPHCTMQTQIFGVPIFQTPDGFIRQGPSESVKQSVCTDGLAARGAWLQIIFAAVNIILTLIGLITFLQYAGELLNPWIWIGAFKPELLVTKRIADKVLDE